MDEDILSMFETVAAVNVALTVLLVPISYGASVLFFRVLERLEKVWSE